MKQILARFFGSSQKAEHALEPSLTDSQLASVQDSTGETHTTCLVIKHGNPEYASSSEFHFLQSYRERQIKKVFGSILYSSEEPGATVQDVPGSPSDSSKFQYVLWFGDDRTLISAKSLAAMKARIDSGVAAVAPCRLDCLLAMTTSPVPKTLRQYEEMEEELLVKREHWMSLAPGVVSLLSGEAFGKMVVNDRELIQSMTTRPGFEIDGICYQFADYYGQAREDIIPFVPSQCSDVLEIGCARGATGKLLHERLGCKVTGVEQNPEIAAQASEHLFKVIVGDIESVSIFEKFDVIIATELFEHLLHPVEFLLKMKALLKPGGAIVLTTPNVGHWSIVEDLMQGRWDYLPMGLLCYTHFRFFTRASLVDLIERAGFTSYEITAQTTEIPKRFSELASSWTVDQESLRTSGFYVVIRA